MSAEKALDLKQRAVLNAKLLIGPGAVALEKWGAHIGAETWARGEAFARGTGSEGFQEALGAMVKTEGDLQTYFGFNTGEQLLMRGGKRFCWVLRCMRRIGSYRLIGIWKKCRNR